MAPRAATLIAGSYDRYVFGYTLHPDASGSLALASIFTHPSHTGPVVAAAAAYPVAATAAASDSVRIYDLRRRSEIGFELSDSSSTALTFFPNIPRAPPVHLISGSEDGFLRIYDVDTFALLSEVRTHRKGGLLDLSVHSSGRVALSVARGGELAMVNLIRGKRSFCCRVGRGVERVEYCGEGSEMFVMSAEGVVTVHDSEDAKVLCEINAGKRVLAMAPAKGGVIFTGGEDKSITAWDLASGKASIRIHDAHLARVKGLVVFGSGDGDAEASHIVSSASSDGIIRVWDLRMAATENPSPLAEANTKSRIISYAGTSHK